MDFGYGRIACVTACLLVFALEAGAALVHSPYASGMKRVYLEKPSTMSVTAGPGAEASVSATSVPETASSQSEPETPCDEIGPVRGYGFVARGRHVPYLPVAGVAPMRFSGVGPVDRAQLVGLDLFNQIMADANAQKNADQAEQKAAQTADEADAAQQSGPVAASDSVQQADAKPDKPVADAVGNPATQTIVAASADTSVKTVPESGNVYVPLDPATLLRYFDSNKENQKARVGVPFVLPYQAAPQLVMPSDATYTQEGKTAAKDTATGDAAHDNQR